MHLYWSDPFLLIPASFLDTGTYRGLSCTWPNNLKHFFFILPLIDPWLKLHTQNFLSSIMHMLQDPKYTSSCLCCLVMCYTITFVLIFVIIYISLIWPVAQPWSEIWIRNSNFKYNLFSCYWLYFLILILVYLDIILCLSVHFELLTAVFMLFLRISKIKWFSNNWSKWWVEPTTPIGMFCFLKRYFSLF